MATKRLCLFGGFRLEEHSELLWDGERSCSLRPKTFAMLRYLLARRGELVSKAELLSVLWPGVRVDEAALAVCVHELRHVLRDEARSPRFIETSHRRGYRFIAEIKLLESGEQPAALDESAQAPDAPMVGRHAQIDLLKNAWALALAGKRQVMFISGEPGIGKTALIDAFRAIIRRRAELVWGTGQCIEQYGERSAYLPVLEALEQMAHRSPEVRRVLRARAPSWLAHLPGLIDPHDGEVVRLAAAGAGHKRMMREMAESLELLAATRPMVLVLEDLHAGDRSTVNLISYLTRRREPARLMVIGTYRSTERTRPGLWLKDQIQELRVHRPCQELRLGLLSEAAVTEFLRLRMRKDTVPLGLAEQVFRRTEGNPLFMTALIEHLLAHNGTSNGGSNGAAELTRMLPRTVRQVIERQIEQLPLRDRRVLEVASVAGMEFSAAQVQAGLASGVAGRIDEIEARCEELAHHTSFLDSRGVAQWPDDTVAARFAFRHSLYREVLYDSMGAARRGQAHLRIGRRMEIAYGDRTNEIAAELAMHFENGGDNYRCVGYLTRSAEIALGRSAEHEAADAAKRGLALLKDVRSRPQELRLRVILGTALMSQFGFGAPEVAAAYRRARTLIEQLGHRPGLAPVLLGIAKFHVVRRELNQAQELTGQCLRLAQDRNDTALALAALATMAGIFYSRGRYADCLGHASQAIQLHDPRNSPSDAVVYGLDSGILARLYTGLALWHLGYPDRARKQARQAVALGQQLGHSHTWSMALAAEALVHGACRDWAGLERCAEKLGSLTEEKEIRFWHGWATFYRGQVLAGQGRLAEGRALMRQANVELEASGADPHHGQFLCLVAEVAGRSADSHTGLRVVSQSLTTAVRTGCLLDEPELHRIAGLLTLNGHGREFNGNGREPGRPTGVEAKAEASFVRAIEAARRLGAKSYELRAVMDLCRLWRSRGKIAAAHRMLSETYNWFTEGFDTGDVKEARVLLEELGS
jgi:DNA-binding winged helix-turn-helix (wHTH) protein/tetratricopeptide (TPR) repeat protein